MEVVENKHFAVVVEATAGSDLDKAPVVVAVVAVAAAVVVVVFAYVVVVVVVAAAGIEVVAVVAGNFVAVLGKVVAELGHFPVLVVTSGSFSHSLTRLNMTHCSVAFAVGGTDY